MVASLVPWWAGSGARADTGPGAGAGSEALPVPDAGLGWLAPLMLAIAILGVGFAISRLPDPFRRFVTVAAILVAAGLVGGLAILAGLFSDFSGQHRIAWPALILGIAVIATGILRSVRVARR